MRPCDSVTGHALHAVRPALVLEDRVGAVAVDGEGVLAVADLERLDLEAQALGVLGQHAVDVARPQPGLLAAGPALDLDDHVLVVGRIALDHGQADLLVELLQAPARGGQHLAHLGILALVEQLLRPGGVVGRAAPLLGELGGALEARVLAPDVGVALAIVDDLGVGHRARELGEARLDLLDERLDHATTSMPILSSSETSRGSSTASTASMEAMATASWSRSGSRVVSFCSCRPGAHHGAHPAPAAVAPGELDDLERDAGDQRHADDAREHQPVPGGQADRGEDEDRHDHHDEQEARPAARVQAAEALGVLGRELEPRLVAGDRLVLGAVVLEDAAQVAQAREQQQVAEEDRGAHDPLDEPEEERRVELVLDEARQPDRHDEEQADGERQRDDARCRTTCRPRSPSPPRAAGRWPRCPAP